MARDNLVFWRVPLLAFAALVGAIGIGISAKIELGSGSIAALAPLPWALGGACITLAIADIVHHGRLNLARFQVVLIGVCALLAHLFILYAVTTFAIILIAWFVGSLLSEIF